MSEKNEIGKYRLQIVEYFDSVARTIDLFTEQKNVSNCDDDEGEEARRGKLNQDREILIKEVKECERLNLNHLNAEFHNLSNLEEDTSQLFVSFCFLVRLESGLRLIVTDTYLTVENVELFVKLILFQKFPPRENESYAEVQDMRELMDFFYVDNM
jgi:hypothetical protein